LLDLRDKIEYYCSQQLTSIAIMHGFKESLIYSLFGMVVIIIKTLKVIYIKRDNIITLYYYITRKFKIISRNNRCFLDIQLCLNGKTKLNSIEFI